MKPQQVFDKLSLIQHKSELDFTFHVSSIIVLGEFNIQIPISKNKPIYVPTMEQLIKILGTSFAAYDNHLSWWVEL